MKVPSYLLPTAPAAAGGSFQDLWGNTITGTITGVTAHTWVDDATGLFHTTTDLQAEWAADYAQMVAHGGAGLTPEQRMEAQAQAVFLNTGLSALPALQQGVIREDVQRELDAIGAAMQTDQQLYGTDPNAALTEQTYVQLNHTLMSTPQLEELAIQGHGLNHPPLPRYSGYTNDAQNNTDNITRYVGPGPDRGEKAVADFMDDAIMTHACFGVALRNGHYIQLNQNGQKESSLAAQVQAMDRTMYGKLLTSKDFARS